MSHDFYNGEKLYRSIRPIQPFVKEDGSISSGAFKDRDGLSVDRQFSRENEIAVDYLKKNTDGEIYSVTTNDCDEKNICYTYCPVEENEYHSELHKNKETKKLTDAQAKHLSKVCKKED